MIRVGSLQDVLTNLPDDLRGSDVLIDSESTALDVIDVAGLIEEILIRRQADGLMLLHPPADLAETAVDLAASAGVASRLYIDPG